MNHEEIAQALIAEGDRRRNNEVNRADEYAGIEGFGEYGDGLSREERDQWVDAAQFVRDLAERSLRPHSNPDSNHLDLS